MSTDYRTEPLQHIYKATPEMKESLEALRDHLHSVCDHCAQRAVRVETLDGDVFEGDLIHYDKGIVYLRQQNQAPQRAFFPGPGPGPFVNNDVVLPLVLFNLLTISLLA